jgi:predicted MFS family arabinose efflux permease
MENTEQKEISTLQLIILAIAAGVCVANIYYSQPIIITLAKYFNVEEAVAGQMPIFSQAGYGFGLLFLAPLGDKFARKKLIIILQALLIVSLLGVTMVKSIEALFLLNFLIGFFSVATQVIMPFAAALAGANKGKVVGSVFTGLLVGILGARIFSGFIANQWNWQLVYLLSAALLLLTSISIWFTLPSAKGSYSGSYLSLVGSSIKQITIFPLLRKCAALSFLVFGAFCSFWTTLTFHLAKEFNYNSNQIGLFGILGIGGALVAPLIGKIADKRNPGKMQTLTITMVILSIVLMWVFSHSVWAIIAGVVLLDIAVQSTVVINIAQIYSLDETAHSRINTIYMTLTFIGGAIGTTGGLYAWKLKMWDGVSIQMIGWTVLAVIISLIWNKKMLSEPKVSFQ